jgi:4-oxalocrotonate tautomerase family enzyme
VVAVPLVEMIFGQGTLSAEQRMNLARKVTDLVVQETKQSREYVWVLIHDEPLENFLLGGLTIQEVRAKLMAEKK